MTVGFDILVVFPLSMRKLKVTVAGVGERRRGSIDARSFTIFS